MIKRQLTHHCNCGACMHQADESKRSGTLLNKAGYLLFPTDSLKRKVSLTGSEDIKDAASEFTVAKKKMKDLRSLLPALAKSLKNGDFGGDLVDRAYKEDLPETLNQLRYILALKPDKTFEKAINKVIKAIETALSSESELGQFYTGSQIRTGNDLLDPTKNQDLLNSAATKITDIDKKLDELLKYDAASLRQTFTNITDDGVAETYSAFSANDPRYPNGEDLDELKAFFDRKYKLVCVLPGSLIIDTVEGLVKHPEEEFVSVTELSDDMKRRVSTLLQQWRGQDYQCANCTEDTHSLAFVIQAVGHTKSENDTFDPITEKNDLFIVGAECFGSLISDSKHYAGENTGDAEALFTSRSTFDEVANSIKLMLMSEAKLRSLLETDAKTRGDNLTPPILGIDSSDSLIRLLYCGRGEQLSRDLDRDTDLYQPSTIGEITISNPKIGAVTVKRLMRLFNKTSQEYSKLNIVITKDRDEFAKAVKTQIQALVGDVSEREIDPDDIKKAGAKDIDAVLVRHAFNVLREVFDYNEAFIMRPYSNSIRVIGREINQEGYKSDFNTGFVITLTQNDTELNMTATVPGAESLSLWKTLTVHAPIGYKDEDDTKVVTGEADIHYAFLRKKDCIGKEIKPLTTRDVLQAVRNVDTQKSEKDEETVDGKVLACIKKMNDSLENQSITITGKPEDDATAVNQLESITSTWSEFLAEALQASYKNLSEIGDKVELSTKAGNRSIIPLASSSDYVQGKSPTEQLREFDPSRFDNPIGRTVIGGKIKSSGASDINDVTDMYWPSIQTILKNNKAQFILPSGKAVKSKKDFVEYMDGLNYLDRKAARGIVAQAGVTNIEDADALTTMLYKVSANMKEVPENRTLEARLPLGIKKKYI